MQLSDEDAKKLVIAARLLRSRDWPGGPLKIQQQDGESFPAAVQRIARSLPPQQRAHLRELVIWVWDFDSAPDPDF